MLHHNRYKMMNQSLFFQQLIPHRAWRSSLWNIKLLILFLHFCVDEHHIRRMTVTDIVEPADRQTERKTVEIDAAQTEIIWLSVPSININIQLKQNVCVCVLLRLSWLLNACVFYTPHSSFLIIFLLNVSKPKPTSSGVFSRTWHSSFKDFFLETETYSS